MKCNGLVFAVLLMAICSDGFIFTKKKVDCLVSKWSMWSEVYGFGVRSKERVILRYPDNGGKACPTNTTILHYSPKKPTIKATASQIVTSFLHRNVKPSTLSPRSNYKRDVPIGLFRDLLIIIDSSGSVGHTNFNIAKQQVAELLGLLCPLPDPFNTYRNTGYNRAALIQYSRRVVEEFDFNAKKNIADLQSSIKKVRYIGRMTCTGDAFEKAINMFTSAKGMRQGTKHEVLILTDGQSNCGKSLSLTNVFL